MKFQWARFASVLVLTLALSACGKDPSKLSLQEYAAYATQALGVTVTVNAEEGDVCARRQLTGLYEQYLGLTEDEQSTVKRKFKIYGAIIVEGTVETSQITGSKTVLGINVCIFHSGGSCIQYGLATKVLSSRLDKTGSDPVTQISKGEQLVITPQSALDFSTNKTYLTKNNDIFEMIQSDQDDLFTRGLEAGVIELSSNQAANLLDCGKLARIQDLLKADLGT